MFSAKATLMVRKEEGWEDSNILLKSVSDIKSLFKREPEEVNLGNNCWIFYNINENGVQAKTVDIEGQKHYMSSPLLVIQCDDTKPIDISNNILNFIKETIDFF